MADHPKHVPLKFNDRVVGRATISSNGATVTGEITDSRLAQALIGDEPLSIGVGYEAVMAEKSPGGTSAQAFRMLLHTLSDWGLCDQAREEANSQVIHGHPMIAELLRELAQRLDPPKNPQKKPPKEENENG